MAIIMSRKIILVITILFLMGLSQADDEVHENFDIKALKDAGKITSLELILQSLSSYDINRILEIELKREESGGENGQYIYEIEYINDKGVVLEVEVDALTAQVIKIEREH